MLWETIYTGRNCDSLSHTYIASYIPKMESTIKTSLTKYTTYVATPQQKVNKEIHQTIKLHS